MAFIPNDGDIILDAVLTDLGRQRMARGDGSFRVSKFALSDDEINYKLWNSADRNNQVELERSPIMEAMTNNTSTLKSFLVTYPVKNLMYLPVMKLNEKISTTKSVNSAASGNGMFFVVTNEETKNSLQQSLDSESNSALTNDGIIDGAPTTTGNHINYIRIDQGIDNIAREYSSQLPAELKETSYEIMMDSRFLTLHTPQRTPANVGYTDDDGFDYYYVSLDDGSGPFVYNNESYQENNPSSATEVIAGSRGTILTFSLGSTRQLADSDFFFSVLGGGTVEMPALSSVNYKYIDTTVRVKGMTTGYSIDVPVRVIRK